MSLENIIVSRCKLKAVNETKNKISTVCEDLESCFVLCLTAKYQSKIIVFDIACHVYIHR